MESFTAESLKTYAFSLSENGQVKSFDDPGEEIHRRVKEFMLDHHVEDYQQALTAVLDADEELKIAYARS